LSVFRVCRIDILVDDREEQIKVTSYGGLIIGKSGVIGTRRVNGAVASFYADSQLLEDLAYLFALYGELIS